MIYDQTYVGTYGIWSGESWSRRAVSSLSFKGLDLRGPEAGRPPSNAQRRQLEASQCASRRLFLESP
jgi:hypothetical protein